MLPRRWHGYRRRSAGAVLSAERRQDGELQELLEAAGVLWRPLVEAERADAESHWRSVYGQAFRGRPRLRHRARADAEYSRQPPCRWLVVPLSSGVEGTPHSCLAEHFIAVVPPGFADRMDRPS